MWRVEVIMQVSTLETWVTMLVKCTMNLVRRTERRHKAKDVLLEKQSP